MKQFKILKVLRKRNYLLISIFSFLLMLIIYPVIQTLPQGLNNLDVWFEITPFSYFLIIVFSFIFSLLLILQIYDLRETKVCEIRKSVGGFFGTFIGFLIGQCSACLSLASFFLPLGAISFLVAYNYHFMVASISLMILGIYLLGGFKKI